MICSCCGSPLCEYKDNSVKERICWNCGYYESDSQAHKENPEIFVNMVRENPRHFIEKFIKAQASDGFLQRRKSDKDFTAPEIDSSKQYNIGRDKT